MRFLVGVLAILFCSVTEAYGYPVWVVLSDTCPDQMVQLTSYYFRPPADFDPNNSADVTAALSLLRSDDVVSGVLRYPPELKGTLFETELHRRLDQNLQTLFIAAPKIHKMGFGVGAIPLIP